MSPIGRGMVFGVFDTLHEGHMHFLNYARAHCDKLFVVVAPDAVVLELKGKKPHEALERRMQAIRDFDTTLAVVPGDEQTDTWKVLDTYMPEIIFLGYDQQRLAQSLDARAIPYMYVSSHEPQRLKSSLMKPEENEKS